MNEHPLMVALRENKCGDKECEDFRENAAIDVLRGIKTSHRANAELVYHTEQAWADAAGTEAVMRAKAEKERNDAITENARLRDEVFAGRRATNDLATALTALRKIVTMTDLSDERPHRSERTDAVHKLALAALDQAPVEPSEQ